MTDLSYNARLALGAISARRQFADEARANAMACGRENDWGSALRFHHEADQHEQIIIAHAQNLVNAL